MHTQSDTLFKLLAQFLVGSSSSKSVALATGSLLAQEWRDLRAAAGVFGYPTLADTEAQLRKILCAGLVQRTALEKCHDVLSGKDTTQQSLIEALRAATEALK